MNDTAGQAHPYWYEWFVGLIEVVKLLNPDEGIETVAFQVASIHGWDDVVVKHSKGKCFYQVKHTRQKNNLTFGSLVEFDDKGQSLLGSLFEGARSSGLIDVNNELILYTNRKDGEQWSTRNNGDRRPPLLEFWRWLKSEIENSGLGDISVPSKYTAAWNELTTCFKSTGDDATEFLRQLNIRAQEDDLTGLESRIRKQLATAFAISEAQSASLFDALCRELRIWTTGHSGVTVEVLSDALTLDPDPKEFAPAPPPPSPFFPTRLPVAEQLQKDLLNQSTPPVVFLTGEPGSGKTSAVSWLANRRTESAFQGIIGIRFFCFEPIRPEQPFIAPDASRVKPEELWFSLLTQLRRGLQGRLHELEVPLRNSFLSWSAAKGHVLRLADVLGKELGRRFVISIDGIDHAARAAQVIPEQVADFFASLPSPDEVDAKFIRLLIAGQPPNYYRNEYPAWLVAGHHKVLRIDLPRLQQNDIRCLLVDSTTLIQRSQTDEAVRLIDELSAGNTLSVVFAVAEAESCSSLEELEARLKERSLEDGLLNYYESIWRYALRAHTELGCTLAGAISLARTAVSAEKLSKIFSVWQKPAPAWDHVLLDLGPLLIRQSDRYLIRHNDVRVFLAGKFSSFAADNRRTVVSQIADHFAGKDSDRLAAHIELFDLLKLADRSVEAAGIFDVDWVLEGATLGIGVDHLLREGEAAVSALSNAQSWSNVVSVSCALETLDRVSEYTEHNIEIEPWRRELPPFLPAEVSVRPFAQWTKSDFHRLVWDARELVEGGAHDRAKGLLSRWLDGLSIERVVQSIPDLHSNDFHQIRHENEPHLDERVKSEFEILGSLSAKVGWEFWGHLTNESPRIEADAFYAFEKGFVSEVTKSPSVDSLDKLFLQRELRFFANHEFAIRNLVRAGSWMLVKEFLESNEDHRDFYSGDFLLEASWYALRSGISLESHWLSDMTDEKTKLSKIPKYHIGAGLNLTPFVNTARAQGWTRTSLDTADIADLICEAFEPSDDASVTNATKLLFRTAAVLGRFEGHAARSTWDSAHEPFTAKYIRQLLSALWGDVIYAASYRFEGRLESSKLAEELADYCAKIGGEFDNAALEAALPLAEHGVLGPRLNAIWRVVKRHGRIDVLRKWISKYIANGGAVWSWAPESARQTANELLPLARSIGMSDVADYAEIRARRLIVGYRNHKEYSFERVNDWFSDAAKNDPAIWSNEGWRLWELCRICAEKDGDNRLESEALKAVSSAAIRAGKTTAWWRLVSTTLPKRCERNWHYKISRQFVDGYIEALTQGLTLTDAEILPVWSIALSLSYWVENSDTSSLRNLRSALLRQASLGRRAEIESAMTSVNPILLNRSDDSESEPDADPNPSLSEGPRDEIEWWKEIEKFLDSQKLEGRHWGYASGLMSIARRRALLHGNDELLPALNTQLDMHVRWAFGGEELSELPKLTELQLASVDDVFVQLVNTLFDTFSVEVTVAALEGLHSFVAQNPAIIPRLFNEVIGEWPQRWLLSASESWAVVHPHQLAAASQTISHLMESGDLDCRLQAWIVLTRNAQILGIDPPSFPLPDESERSIEEVENVDLSLLHVPSTPLGSVRFANKFSSTRNLIRYCGLFGFRFERLQGVIAQALIELSDRDGGDLRIRGPHRYADYTYVPADAEKAFGTAVLSILNSKWCDDSMIAELSQAVLSNEDSWIHRSRPMAIRSVEEWPSESEYGPNEISSGTRRMRMLNAAKSTSVEDGWKVFATRVQDFTHKADFDLHYWFEESQDSLLISAPRVPTCPGGRSFIWWIGQPIELGLDRFVSGLFVGGHQRLSQCHFEIRPPAEWRDEFGWSPNPANPLQWYCDGEMVAKYERLHGVLRDAPHGPKYRQPFIHRWIVTTSAFETVNEKYPQLRERDTFDEFPFDA